MEMETVDFSDRKKYKSNVTCCVCGTRSSDNPSVRFHRFPKQNVRTVNRENFFGVRETIDHLKAWKLALKISNVTPTMVVCSLHFKQEDYFYPETVTRVRLKNNAVPSVKIDKKNLGYLKRRLARSEKQEKVLVTENKKEQKDEQIQLVSDQIMEPPVQECEQSETVDNDVSTFVNVEMKQDAVTQTDVIYLLARKKILKDTGTNTFKVEEPNFVSNIKTDSELSTVTGIESFSILNTIVDMVKNVYGDRFEAENMKMKTKDRIILVYTKLKQNLSYSLLAIMFNAYTSNHVHRIFEEMIQVLSNVFKIPWPSRDETRSNLPKCFKGFEDTRIILDCIEVQIQHPKEECCQILTYSPCKSHETAKVMIGISPSGTITYISRVYGGRASDATIFEHSGLINRLEPGDGIMVDRDFLIDSLCETNGCRLIRSPCLKDKQKFSKEEALLTSKIALARIHISRLNQRIKTFKIIGSVLPANVLILLEEIFTVISATINMSSPILKSDKFMTS